MNNTFKKIDTTCKIPIKMWLEDLEQGALEQARNLANLPFAFKHIAIMPDSHQGYGMPIGSVLATFRVVIPNAVGVDIGCGMCAVRTNIKLIEKAKLRKVIEIAKNNIPVGFNWHEEPQDAFMPEKPDGDSHPLIHKHYEKARFQLGTLGGGNHFIEIQKGSDGFIWIMIHSGSRNLGFNVAKHYNIEAKKINAEYHSTVTPDMELAFLPIDSELGRAYFREMTYCVEFAKQNRLLMMRRMALAFSAAGVGTENIPLFGREIINESHNFAAWENHYGKNVIVHRKGATRAYEGELGMVPSSMGTKSYIVKGLGNEESFRSCSHGAGKTMSRKAARDNLSLSEELKTMKGVIHGLESTQDLDEAPSAYKDINIVMKNQEALTEVVVELSPLAVIKG